MSSRIFIIIICLMLISTLNIAAEETWEMVRQASFKQLMASSFVGAKYGWAVDIDGVFLRMEDGEHWNIQARPKFPQHSAIFFLNKQKGWLGGNESLLTTDDGGVTWKKFKIDNLSFSSLQFINKDIGWALDSRRDPAVPNRSTAKILHTQDGGKTWEIQGDYSDTFLSALFFVNEKIGWAVGSRSHQKGLILSTKDGGRTWNRITNLEIDPGWISDVQFLTTDIGWAVGAEYVLSTSDGGSTWRVRRVGNLWWLNSLFFVTPDRGWIVGQKGTILSTRDGGDTWVEQNSGTTDWLLDVYFADAKTGWIRRLHGMLYTENGGETWRDQIEPSSEPIYDIGFADSQNGWAPASFGKLLHTEDGGQTWKTIFVESIGAREFSAIDFVDKKHGWMVGEFRNFVLTDDGGQTWQDIKVNNVPNRNLRAVKFVDADHGWVIGSLVRTNDMVMWTEDGGQTWKFVLLNDIYLFNLDFVDVKRGWLVGFTKGGGCILHTKDGGRTWKTQMAGAPSLAAIQFVNENEGWAVGGVKSAAVFHTDDGGKHWTQQEINLPYSLVDLFFLNDKEGWVIGKDFSKGIIAHTKDAGRTWEVQFQNDFSPLRSINAKNDSLWVSGDYGLLLRYQSSRLKKFLNVRHDGEVITTWGRVKSALYQNYPNPFNPETWIPYQLSKPGYATLKIYDLQGKLVRTLPLGYRQAGAYLNKKEAAYWDGRNNQGESVSSGVYFYTIIAKDFIASRKMVLVR